jgi:hypothetical protein
MQLPNNTDLIILAPMWRNLESSGSGNFLFMTKQLGIKKAEPHWVINSERNMFFESGWASCVRAGPQVGCSAYKGRYPLLGLKLGPSLKCDRHGPEAHIGIIINVQPSEMSTSVGERGRARASVVLKICSW